MSQEKLHSAAETSTFSNSTSISLSDYDSERTFGRDGSEKNLKDPSGKKYLSRWDECEKKAVQPISTSKFGVSPKTSKVKSEPSLETVTVREFLPRSTQDPILPILRELFVRSFDDYYKEIEEKLKLKTGKTLLQWLRETFDEMEEEMLNRECRCFILCMSTLNNEIDEVVGFLTLREQEGGTIYIAQCAIHPDYKRRGFGARLLQHLRTMYPTGTSYVGLCRRANEPAIQFYLKQGAILMNDDLVARKYNYDAELYTGFQFVDNQPNPSANNASAAPTTPPAVRRIRKSSVHAEHVDCGVMTDELWIDNATQKKSKKKKTTTTMCGGKIGSCAIL